MTGPFATKACRGHNATSTDAWHICRKILNMPRKKKTEKTVCEQTEEYLRQLIIDFELITGMHVAKIEVTHRRPIGFGAKEALDVNIITE